MARSERARPTLHGTFGMVASTHWIASAVGMAVLERGGNAFDAATAAGFVLQVVEPDEHGPGGEMVALLHVADRDCPLVVCGQGPASSSASIERMHELGLRMIPGDGLLPAVVPGVVGGWLLVLRDFGTWPLRDVLEFALGYAGVGFPMTRRTASVIAKAAPTLRARWPESAAIWLPGGEVPREGARLRNPILAETFARVLTEAEAAGGGREAQIDAALRCWYSGFVAESIDRFMRRAAELDTDAEQRLALLRGEDMAAWRPSLGQPASYEYHGWRVFKPGLWSQGPVFLQQLAVLLQLGLRSADIGSAEWMHAIVECAKLAYADREAWYGDPSFGVDVTERLLDPGYNEMRRRLVAGRASRELRPGRVDGLTPRIPWPSGTVTPEPPAPTQDRALEGVGSGDTCHVDVVDRWGNLVSATPSGGWLQSSPAVAGLGFCLGTRAQMFNLERGHPNALAPGKRPRTTLSPSIALRDDGTVLAFGTPGADEQDQWSLSFFLRVADGSLDAQAAIDAPMFHTNHCPRSEYPHGSDVGSLVVEDSLAEDVATELRQRGHDVAIKPRGARCRLSAVGRDHSGWMSAAVSASGVYGQALGR